MENTICNSKNQIKEYDTLTVIRVKAGQYNRVNELSEISSKPISEISSDLLNLPLNVCGY